MGKLNAVLFPFKVIIELHCNIRTGVYRNVYVGNDDTGTVTDGISLNAFWNTVCEPL
jgi:hypothetical protein